MPHVEAGDVGHAGLPGLVFRVENNFLGIVKQVLPAPLSLDFRRMSLVAQAHHPGVHVVLARELDALPADADFLSAERILEIGGMVEEIAGEEAVEMVLGGRINKEIVGLIQRHGGRAVGISGRDGQLLRAIKMQNLMDGAQEVDLGLVGEVEGVNPEILKTLEDKGFIPVIAPIGEGPQGEIYNINADDVAGAVAAALHAEKLILLTDVPGILAQDGALISTMTAGKAEELTAQGIITSGMIPKVRSCLRALKRGVAKAHILDGRVDHVLLLEVFTQEGVGTQIVSPS